MIIRNVNNKDHDLQLLYLTVKGIYFLSIVCLANVYTESQSHTQSRAIPRENLFVSQDKPGKLSFIKVNFHMVHSKPDVHHRLFDEIREITNHRDVENHCDSDWQ